MPGPESGPESGGGSVDVAGAAKPADASSGYDSAPGAGDNPLESETDAPDGESDNRAFGGDDPSRRATGANGANPGSAKSEDTGVTAHDLGSIEGEPLGRADARDPAPSAADDPVDGGDPDAGEIVDEGPPDSEDPAPSAADDPVDGGDPDDGHVRDAQSSDVDRGVGPPGPEEEPEKDDAGGEAATARAQVDPTTDATVAGTTTASQGASANGEANVAAESADARRTEVSGADGQERKSSESESELGATGPTSAAESDSTRQPPAAKPLADEPGQTESPRAEAPPDREGDDALPVGREISEDAPNEEQPKPATEARVDDPASEQVPLEPGQEPTRGPTDAREPADASSTRAPLAEPGAADGRPRDVETQSTDSSSDASAASGSPAAQADTASQPRANGPSVPDRTEDAARAVGVLGGAENIEHPAEERTPDAAEASGSGGAAALADSSATSDAADDRELRSIEGDPFGRAGDHHWQGRNELGYQGTCGCAAVADTARFQGRAATENDVVQFAAANGLCETSHADPADNGGMTTDSMRQALDHYGLDSEVRAGQSLNDLAGAVGEGHGVIASVNAGSLWGDAGAYGNGELNHAVAVTGIERDVDTGAVTSVYVNDFGDPNGGGAKYSAATFAEAWEASGGVLNVTDDVSPFLPVRAENGR